MSEQPREFSIEIAAQNIELANNNWYLGPKVRKYIRLSLEYAKNEYQQALTAANAEISDIKSQYETCKETLAQAIKEIIKVEKERDEIKSRLKIIDEKNRCAAFEVSAEYQKDCNKLNTRIAELEAQCKLTVSNDLKKAQPYIMQLQIDVLKAKLSKAIEALKFYGGPDGYSVADCSSENEPGLKARQVLAEIE